MSLRDLALEAAFLMIAFGAALGVWSAIIRPWRLMSGPVEPEVEVVDEDEPPLARPDSASEVERRS